jgi:hypothetical protein
VTAPAIAGRFCVGSRSPTFSSAGNTYVAHGSAHASTGPDASGGGRIDALARRVLAAHAAGA